MESNTTTLRNLLSQISIIRKKFAKIAEITGDNFNLFQILNVQTDEVGTHSAFLCELLSAKGSHGKKNSFIEIFINQQMEKGNFSEKLRAFETENSNALSEYYIGSISDDKTKGGKIDILLTDNKKNEIIIENKIYAPDQESQLLRYHNFNQNAPIFYLTLNDNQKPKANSIQRLNEGKHFVCISYKYDIVNWLKICLEKSADKPILRESIKQYIHLIKYLTSQTMNEDMKKEIIELITKEEDYFRAAEEIFVAFDEAKKKFYFLQWQQTIDKISKEYNLTKEIPEESKEYDSDLGLIIKIKGVEHYIIIGFEDECVNKVYISLRKPNIDAPPDNEVIEKINDIPTNGKFAKEKIYIYSEKNDIDYCAICYCDIKNASDIYTQFANVLLRTFSP